MKTETTQLVDRYLEWLRGRIHLEEVGDWVEITTPFLDRHNDFIQIYVHEQNGGYVLTDDGYTISDLEQSGCELKTPKRRRLLASTVKGFGLEVEGKALTAKATRRDFPRKKHLLLQGILAVDDLFYLASPHVASFFLEDVATWLEGHEVRFSPKVRLVGESGYDHLFDFVVPKSRREPERLLKAFNSPNRQAVQSMVFAWVDTRKERDPDTKAYAVLNDQSSKVSQSVLDGLESYDVKPVPWSHKDELIEELAA